MSGSQENNPGQCSVCEDHVEWRWHTPGLVGNYCIECIAHSLRHTIMDPAGSWPPRIEDEPIPVEQLAERLHALAGAMNDNFAYPWDGLMASYRECSLYRHISNPDHRIFCPHPSVEGQGRPLKLLEPESERCNHFIWRKEHFAEGEPHTWRQCTWCGQSVCSKCGRGRSDFEPSARGNSICTRTQNMIDHALIEDSRANDGLGTGFQLCPNSDCRNASFPFEGCNAIPCPCGTCYCFICGAVLPDIEGAGGHFVLGGCPRFHTREDPRAHWDPTVTSPIGSLQPSDDAPEPVAIPQWEFDSGRLDFANYDTNGLESLLPRIVSEKWQAATERIGIEPFNPERIAVDQAQGDSEKAWFQGWITRLMIAANNMFTMIANGLEFGGATADAREACVLRRLRFAHHALTFRFVWTRLRLRFGEDFELPGCIASYELLVPYSRALRFLQGAVPNDLDVRIHEWKQLFDFVEDQLSVQYPTTYLLDASRSGRAQVNRAAWIRSLLEPIRAMLPALRRYTSPATKAFSLPDSATLRTKIGEIRERLHQLGQQHGAAAFSMYDAEQQWVYRVAELFAHRLLEDEGDATLPQRALGWAETPSRDNAQDIFAGVWANDILDAIDADVANLNRRSTNEMPERIPELYRTLSALRAAVDSYNEEPNPPSGISAHRLANIRRLAYSHLVWHGPPDADGNRDWRIVPGEGPLRAIFFRAYTTMNFIDERLGDDRARQRSSVNSLMDNTLSEDINFANHQLIAFLGSPRLTSNVSRRHTFIIDVLERFRNILLRMEQPGQLLGVSNQEDFDWLHDQLRRHKLDLLEVEGLDVVNDVEWRRIVRALARRLPEAEISIEINPAGPNRRLNLEAVAMALRSVDGLTEGLPDGLYIRALQEWIRDYEELWRVNGSCPPDMQALQEFLEALRNAGDFQALPQAFHGEAARESARQFRHATRRFNFHDSVLGDLGTWLRLAQVYGRVVVWVRDARTAGEQVDEVGGHNNR